MLAIVSAKATGATQENAVSPMATWMNRRCGVGAVSVQHGEEHPADDRSDEGDLGEAGERDLAVNGQRDSGGPQDSRPGSGGCGGQDSDRGGGPRNRAGQPGESVLDWWCRRRS